MQILNFVYTKGNVWWKDADKILIGTVLLIALLMIIIILVLFMKWRKEKSRLDCCKMIKSNYWFNYEIMSNLYK